MAETNGLLNRRTGKSGTEGSNPSVSATISLRINEMPLREAKNPQFLRRFAAGTETSETAKTAKFGL